MLLRKLTARLAQLCIAVKLAPPRSLPCTPSTILGLMHPRLLHLGTRRTALPSALHHSSHPRHLSARSRRPTPAILATAAAPPPEAAAPLPQGAAKQQPASAAASAAGGVAHDTVSRQAGSANIVGKMEEQRPVAKRQRVEAGQAIPASAGTAGAGPKPQEQQQQQQQKGKQRKKQKVLTPEAQARLDIQMAARAGDIVAALGVYDKAKAEKLRLPADSYHTLLFLCSLGEDWEASVPKGRAGHAAPAAPAAATAADVAEGGQEAQQAQQQQGRQEGDQEGPAAQGNGAAATPADEAAAGAAGEAVAAAAAPPKASLSPAEVMARGRGILAELQAQGKGASEMCYTALARMAAVAGDPEEAFRVALSMADAGLAPKLRSFTPALAGFAERGDFASADKVYSALTAASLDLTEAEFSRLMQAAAGSASWEEGQRILRAMGRELTVLQRSTLDRIAAFFASERAAAAFGGGAGGSQQPRWAVEECRVGRAGEVLPLAPTPGSSSPNRNSQDSAPQQAQRAQQQQQQQQRQRQRLVPGRMQPIDLDQEEWVSFREGIAALAAQQEKRPNEFQKFLSWLERHGPFGAVVDGANVALYGQNFAAGGFTFDQIKAVRARLAARHPDLKPLVILHVGRTKAPQAREPQAAALLEELRAANQLFVSPAGSNDDWYWIYASVAAGRRGLLVSNDEMRDHIFALLAPKFFAKWKQRHQLKYKFYGTPDSLQFEYPPKFTTCIQELECRSWVLPAAEGPWLCARRDPPAPTADCAEQQGQGQGQEKEIQELQPSADGGAS